MCIRDRCKKFENLLRFDKVTESFKVGTFFETQCTTFQTDEFEEDNILVMFAAQLIIVL